MDNKLIIVALVVLILVFLWFNKSETMIPAYLSNGMFISSTDGSVAYLEGGKKRIVPPGVVKSCNPPIEATLKSDIFNSIPSGSNLSHTACIGRM